ncbi:MAG TPA: site-specific DNA-methyltransferase [Trebonia sp.]|nr:site-specific DNA-methyltransferase [Trebonia sp.]
MDQGKVGPYLVNRVALGDCAELGLELPDESIDVLVTSPPYWGQRTSAGMGVEEDPREYVKRLVEIFRVFKPKLKPDGIVWINLGDAYNTPVNWRPGDRDYSSLGPGKSGLDEDNSAYIKPRARRKAYLRKAAAPWLTYGNLLALPYRMVLGMCDDGWLLRGEVIWRKKNPMPEGRCRRPHRAHEPIYLFATSEKHAFLTDPPVKSVWEFSNERMPGPAHYSRFPLELPRRCVAALGRTGKDVVVLDPFSGSGTSGLAALSLGCSYLGFEIDADQVTASNARLAAAENLRRQPLLRPVFSFGVTARPGNQPVAGLGQLLSRRGTMCAFPGGGGEGDVKKDAGPLRLADHRRRCLRPARVLQQRAVVLQFGCHHRGDDGHRSAQLPGR